MSGEKHEPYLLTALTPELCCSDIAASLAFYTQVLGFTVQYERPEEGFAMLERQGSRLMLNEVRATPRRGSDHAWLTGKLEKPYGRGINFEMCTQDVEVLYVRVQKAGAKIFLPIGEMWYRRDDHYVGNRQFLVQDPDGYLLRFAEGLGTRAAPPKGL